METAVQAQLPYSMLMTDIQTRIHTAIVQENGNTIYATPFSIAPGILEAAQIQPDTTDVLRTDNSIKGPLTGLNLIQQPMLNVAMLDQLPRNAITRCTKRQRDDEVRQHAFFRLPNLQQQQGNIAFVSVVPQSSPTFSSGLRMPCDDVQANLIPSKGKASSLIMLEELQSEILKYKEEVDELVNMQATQMKCLLKEKNQRYATYLAKVQHEQLRRLREKDAELEKANRTNLELEERVKELSLASQLWEKVVRDQEVMIMNLRTCLEQVIQPADAQSCHCGEARYADVEVHEAQTEVGNTCKACEIGCASILLLPCRHLCLCKNCDKTIEWCPICGASKVASLQVYTS